jgi:hypothetical protein
MSWVSVNVHPSEFIDWDGVVQMVVALVSHENESVFVPGCLRMAA